MKKSTTFLFCLGLLAALAGGFYTFHSETPAVAAESASAVEKPMGHMVFFTLKERTPEHRRKLAELCKEYLNDHPGTLYFSAGTVAEEMNRDVNVRDFDVALHLVFKNKKSQDDYQVSSRHMKFIEEGKPLWEKVRVYDSYIQ